MTENSIDFGFPDTDQGTYLAAILAHSAVDHRSGLDAALVADHADEFAAITSGAFPDFEAALAAERVAFLHAILFFRLGS